MRIHITQTTKQFLQAAKYETVERGVLEVSDKIILKTFVVLGKYNTNGTVDMFPYKEETEDFEFLKKSPKWEGFNLVNS
jgi:hypothetical protein